MALTLTPINAADNINSAPEKIQNNLSAIKSVIDKIESKFNLETSKIALTSTLEAPTGGFAGNAILLSGVGTIISVRPNGGALVYSVSDAGFIAAKKINIDGTDTSTINKLSTTEFGVSGISLFAGHVDFNSGVSKVSKKHSDIAISTTNVGESASNPLDISIYGEHIFLDANNSGNPLNGNGLAKLSLNTTALKVGQVVNLYVSRVNSADTIALFNGTASTEKFAVIGLNGYETLDSNVLPTHDNTTPGARLKMIYKQIAPSNFKLVILEKVGFNL